MNSTLKFGSVAWREALALFQVVVPVFFTVNFTVFGFVNFMIVGTVAAVIVASSAGTVRTKDVVLLDVRPAPLV